MLPPTYSSDKIHDHIHQAHSPRSVVWSKHSHGSAGGRGSGKKRDAPILQQSMLDTSSKITGYLSSSSSSSSKYPTKQYPKKGWDFNSKTFGRFGKHETQLERCERMMHGIPRPTASSLETSNRKLGAGHSIASSKQQDMLLYQWRHAAREANKEIVRLNKELVTKATAWSALEKELKLKIQGYESKREQISSFTAELETENDRLRNTLSSMRTKKHDEADHLKQLVMKAQADIEDRDRAIRRLERKDGEVNDEFKTLEIQNKELELLVDKLKTENRDIKAEIKDSNKDSGSLRLVHNELLGKLRFQNSLIKVLFQQLDLISEMSDNDVRDFLNKVIQSQDNDSPLRHLKDYDALSNTVGHYLNEKSWTDKKAVLVNNYKRNGHHRKSMEKEMIESKSMSNKRSSSRQPDKLIQNKWGAK